MPYRLRCAVYLVIVVLLSLPLAALASPAREATGGQYVVKAGDTLADIAWSLGISAGDLGRANGITDFDRIYVGQVLTLPGGTSQPAAGPPPAAEASSAETKTPAAGVSAETQAPVAPTAAEETRPAAAEAATGVQAPVGSPAAEETRPAAAEAATGVQAPAAQAAAEETKPQATAENRSPAAEPAAEQPQAPATQSAAEESSPAATPARAVSSGAAGKWIDVDLSEQRLSAYEGDSLIFTTLVSTGTEQYPTPTGRYKIYDRVRFSDMSGPGYYLTDVPNVMVFRERGFALHGTYWHNNFGHPMSHGCINLSIPDSAWLYGWAPLGTPVIIHD